LSEPKVSIRIREEDKSEVQAVLKSAAEEYKKRTQKPLELVIDTTYLPPGPSKGGFGLTWYAATI